MDHDRVADMAIAPLARYRLYGSALDYFRLVSNLWERPLNGEASVRRLEAKAAELFGVKHAIAMPQNRVGTYLAIKNLVRPGRKVLLSPYTLSDVVNMVICAGAVPVFVDIERETANIDANLLEEAIDEETDAVLVTHLHGLICDVPRIRAICQKHGLKLIEDAAQSCGTSLDGTYSGTYGDAGVLSFGMFKNINSLFGGMVLTNSDALAVAIRAERDSFPVQDFATLAKKAVSGVLTDLATHPLIFKALTYWVFRLGYLKDIETLNKRVRIEDNPQRKDSFPDSYRKRMSPAQARMAERQFDTILADMEHRIACAKAYDEGLRDLNNVIRAPLYSGGRHGYLHYPLQVTDRDEFLRHLFQNRRDIAIQHLRNCAELPCFEPWARDCPNAAATAREMVLMPTYVGYPIEEVRNNVAAIRSYFGAPA